MKLGEMTIDGAREFCGKRVYCDGCPIKDAFNVLNCPMTGILEADTSVEVPIE